MSQTIETALITLLCILAPLALACGIFAVSAPYDPANAFIEALRMESFKGFVLFGLAALVPATTLSH